MKSGFCPKCGSNEVHIYTRSTKLTSNKIPVSFDDYICFNCGYSENYLADFSIRQLKTKNVPETNTESKKSKG